MVASITQYICKGSNYSMYRGGTLYSGDWYRGVHDGDWGELSFSPSPQLEESVEPIRPHTRASEVEYQPRRHEEPRTVTTLPEEEPRLDRDTYRRILYHLDRLEAKQSATCDPSWSEILSDKWKDLLLIGLVVLIIVLIVIWAVRRKSS